MKRLCSLKIGTIFTFSGMFFKLLYFSNYSITLVRFYSSLGNEPLLIPLEYITLPVSFIKKTVPVKVLNCIVLEQRNSINNYYKIKS